MATSKRSLQQAQNYRIVFLGSTRVGKTALLRRFTEDTFCELYNETTDDLTIRQYLVSRSLIRLELFDTGGTNEFPAMQRLVINSADGIVIVFSLADVDSFAKAAERFHEIREIRQDLATLPIVLVGNKQDLGRRVLRTRVNDFLETEGLNKQCNFSYLETSAKTGENVFEIFGALAKLGGIVDNLEAKPKPIVKPPPLHRRLSLQIESSVLSLRLGPTANASAHPSPVSPVSVGVTPLGAKARSESESSSYMVEEEEECDVSQGKRSSDVSRSQDSPKMKYDSSPRFARALKLQYSLASKSPKRFQRFRKESASKSDISEVPECFIM